VKPAAFQWFGPDPFVSVNDCGAGGAQPKVFPPIVAVQPRVDAVAVTVSVSVPLVLKRVFVQVPLQFPPRAGA